MGEKGIKSERIISINEDKKKSRRNSLVLGVQEKASSVLTASGPAQHP